MSLNEDRELDSVDSEDAAKKYALHIRDTALMLARIRAVKAPDVDEANARLMAAAPEMLEALQKLVDAATGRSTQAYLEHELRSARAAIAKATGGKA
jgi:hypothetical protein